MREWRRVYSSKTCKQIRVALLDYSPSPKKNWHIYAASIYVYTYCTRAYTFISLLCVWSERTSSAESFHFQHRFHAGHGHAIRQKHTFAQTHVNWSISCLLAGWLAGVAFVCRGSHRMHTHTTLFAKTLRTPIMRELCQKEHALLFVWRSRCGCNLHKVEKFSVCSATPATDTPSCAVASKLANSVAGVIWHIPCFAHLERANK